MTDAGAFASLSPTLLARKGGAKPAMRPQLQPMQQFHEATAREMHDDLGWNDMGEDVDPADASGAEVVSIGGREMSGGGKPAVVQQRESLEQSVRQPAAPRSSALKQGRRAAFTLRLDAERHLKLKLASTVTSESAQQIVTDALDQYLESMPEVAALATRVRKGR
ncbi:MAG: hypothetical protein R3D89_06425 [Sphingomonadaceae bacterium]|jgi:hypothetical protein